MPAPVVLIARLCMRRTQASKIPDRGPQVEGSPKPRWQGIKCPRSKHTRKVERLGAVVVVEVEAVEDVASRKTRRVRAERNKVVVSNVAHRVICLLNASLRENVTTAQKLDTRKVSVTPAVVAW